jgi:hypothetical protein
MKNKKYYKKYWKRILSYDYNSEFKIYKFLCGEIKWREKRKVPVDKQFKSYSEWKNYVELFYKRKELREIKEFYRYLNCMKRVQHTSYKFNDTFLIPFVVALITGSLAPKLLELQLPIINFEEIFDKIALNALLQKIIVLGLLLLFVIIIFILIVVMIVLPLTLFIISIFNRVSDYKLEVDFYEDYMEIIKEIINEKEN